MIACGVAGGTVITFGAPIGGCIFAIELTSTYYMTGTLWKSFYTSTVTIIVFQAHALYALCSKTKHSYRV